ncbi:MAG: tetratricopeptide repeat protein [Candidatus Pedobacter colombiensis]|uniref:Tetratricopeptide repeat protein n=1 Tax=Candidatus Pedobacter colombiensis TaxID=3121371 RepID=A0AAJ5WBB6_9SPHI|nr:tetratricopeptide repeat protein [Pedobacter sp.]WEK19632.1 MAG: tetratricopeptide repeat protein [Pedobacter sp.]
MRKLLYLIIALNIPLFSIAQNAAKVDQEKLLDFYQAQRYMEAADYLKSVYNDDTEVPKEISQLAYTNMMAGNLPLAEKYYLKLYNYQPNNLPVLFNLANISHRRGDDAKAKSYYLEIIKIDSTNFNVYKQLADMVASSSSPEKISYLKKANAIQPIHPDVAFDLSFSLNLINQKDSAYTVIQTALAADTSNMTLLKAKMPICIALLKIDETIQTGNQLMTFGDSSNFVLNNLGKAYFIKKDYPKALALFKIIEKLQQQNEATLYYTAVCYRELKDYPNSIEYMNLAIKESISPYTSKYYKTLGEVYEVNSMIQKANDSYLRSLSFENDGSVFYNLGLINDFKTAHKNTAVKYYKLYLASKPDPVKYKEVIDYIKLRIANLKDTK